MAENRNGSRVIKVSVAALAGAFAILSSWLAPVKDQVSGIDRRVECIERNIRDDFENFDVRLRRENDLKIEALRERIRMLTARLIDLEKAENRNQRFRGKVEEWIRPKE